MCLRQTGTSMRAASSNSTSPSSAMRPRSGLSSPAIMLTTVVLPAPDGPNKTVAPVSLANFAVTAKSPSFFSTSTANISNPVESRMSAAGEPFRRDQGGKRNDHGDDHQRERGGIAARHLRERVDRRRDGLRLARNVGDESDGGAEFTERTGKRQHHAGDDARQRQRQRDREKQPSAVSAQRRRGVLQPAVDRLDREPYRAHHQRKRH